MDSIDYKLSDVEKKDLISDCTIHGIEQYNLDNISPLPYGYMFCFKDKEGFGNVFIVNLYKTYKDKSIEVEVLPECGFGNRLQKFLEGYFKKHKEFK